MYKKRSLAYMNFANCNKKSIATGQIVVPCILQLKKEKKSIKGNSYYILVVNTLNKTPVFVQFTSKKTDGITATPFEPKMKKVKKDVKEKDEENDFIEKPEDDRIIKKNGVYGTFLKPFSTIMVTTFDRNGSLLLERSQVFKLSLIADAYNDMISFKAGEIILESKWCGITKEIFVKHFLNTELSIIPTQFNIIPSTFPSHTDPKYYSRPFVLPLSNDTSLFKDVEIVLDVEDPKRFYGKDKETDKLIPSVNTDIGSDQIRNNMSVVFENEKEKYFFKFAYMPNIWNIFGISDVDKWSKSAGRMILNASSWFAYGSSKLDDIKLMKANAETIDDNDGLDFGMPIDELPSPSCDDSSINNKNDLIATTGFISNFSLNLNETIKKAGISLSYDFILKNYGPESEFIYNSDNQNPLNTGWKTKIFTKDESFIFNLTETDEYIRNPLLKELKDRNDVKYYGIFSVGNDLPYEKVNEENFETFLIESKITPSSVFILSE